MLIILLCKSYSVLIAIVYRSGIFFGWRSNAATIWEHHLCTENYNLTGMHILRHWQPRLTPTSRITEGYVAGFSDRFTGISTTYKAPGPGRTFVAWVPAEVRRRLDGFVRKVFIIITQCSPCQTGIAVSSDRQLTSITQGVSVNVAWLNHCKHDVVYDMKPHLYIGVVVHKFSLEFSYLKQY